MNVFVLVASLAALTTSPDGIWLTDGYDLFEIRGDTLASWEVTPGLGLT